MYFIYLRLASLNYINPWSTKGGLSGPHVFHFLLQVILINYIPGRYFRYSIGIIKDSYERR